MGDNNTDLDILTEVIKDTLVQLDEQSLKDIVSSLKLNEINGQNSEVVELIKKQLSSNDSESLSKMIKSAIKIVSKSKWLFER